jgi:transcriptional regulator with PAS, ATPase and Fis domain
MYSNISKEHDTECSWCNNKLPIGIIADERISSGLCGDCVTSADFRLGFPLEKYSESIDVPVVIVNDDMMILYANEKTLKFVNKTLSDIYGKLYGDIFQCNYASSNGGCGRTVHCGSCTVNKAVKNTIHDSKMHIQTPALLTQKNINGPIDYIMMVSTEKASEVAMLRIDKIIPFCM